MIPRESARSMQPNPQPISLSGVLRWLLCKRIRVRPEPPQRSALTELLQPGDIVLHREQGDLIGTLTTHFTASPYSHVDLYYGAGWSLSTEAQGISFVTTDRDGKAFVDLCRYPDLSVNEVGQVLAAAHATLASPYEFELLFGFPFLTPAAAVRRSANRAYICSEHVAWAYRKAGVNLVSKQRPLAAIAPADLAQSSKLCYVASFHRGARVADARLNVRHRLQGRPNVLGMALVELLAKPLSLGDEYYRALAASRDHYADCFFRADARWGE